MYFGYFGKSVKTHTTTSTARYLDIDPPKTGNPRPSQQSFFVASLPFSSLTNKINNHGDISVMQNDAARRQVLVIFDTRKKKGGSHLSLLRQIRRHFIQSVHRGFIFSFFWVSPCPIINQRQPPEPAETIGITQQ